MKKMLLHICCFSLLLLSTGHSATTPDDIESKDPKTDVVQASNTHSDADSIKLAYSDPKFNNVGVMYRIIKIPFYEPFRANRASVVHVGGNTCYSAAHCFQHTLNFRLNFFADAISFIYNFFPNHYEVIFEYQKGEFTTYNVKKYVTHPDYSGKTYDADIAVVCLENADEISKKLDSLKPNYLYGLKYEENTLELPQFGEQYWKQAEHHRLTYVGYSIPGTDDVEGTEKNRKASQSIFKKCANSNGFYKIFSIPFAPQNRKPFPHETGIQYGMSGGLTWHNEHGFVGINSNASLFFSEDDLSEVKRNMSENYKRFALFLLQRSCLLCLAYYDINAIYEMMYYILAEQCKERDTYDIYKYLVVPAFSIAVIYIAFKSPEAYIPKKFQSRIEVSTPLGAYQTWLEEWRVKFDNDQTK